MRRTLAVMLAFMFAFPIGVLQSAPAQQQVMVECRDLGSGANSYVAPNETIINGKACRPAGTQLQVIGVAAAPAQPAPTAPAVAAPDPVAPAPAAAASTPVTGTTPSPTNESPRGIVLEDGTPVHLILSQNLSSADAVTGQTVEFEVVDDIIVNGLVVIPHGSTAWATVTDAEHKRRMGRAGKLDLNIDKVRLADGEKALLRAVKDTKGGGHTGAMVGAMVATSLIIWPAAPLFLLMHGKDVTIPKGTAITAFTQGDLTLDASRFPRQLLASR